NAQASSQPRPAPLRCPSAASETPAVRQAYRPPPSFRTAACAAAASPCRRRSPDVRSDDPPPPAAASFSLFRRLLKNFVANTLSQHLRAVSRSHSGSKRGSSQLRASESLSRRNTALGSSWPLVIVSPGVQGCRTTRLTLRRSRIAFI